MQKAAQTVELSEAEYEDYQKISSEWKKLSHMQSGFMNSILMGTNISYDKAKGLCIVFTNKFNYELMLRQERMEELRQMLNKQYQKEFSITAKLLLRQVRRCRALQEAAILRESIWKLVLKMNN